MLSGGRRRHQFTMGSPAEKVERNVSLISIVKSHLSNVSTTYGQFRYFVIKNSDV